MFKISALFVLLILFGFVKSKPDKIVCYFGSWSNYRPSNGKFIVEDIDPTLCTHGIYSFVGINSDGSIRLLDSWLDIDLKAMERFVALKQKNSNFKPMVAIGGWNEGSQKYSDVVSNSNTRATFVKNVVKFLQTHKFDGFDLDWEYPNQRGGRESDKGNFVLLTKELREAFDKVNPSWVLSAAVQATQEGIGFSYDVPTMSKHLSFINVMTYDLHGSWDGHTGHHTGLYANPIDTTPRQKELNVDACISSWIKAGAPSNKILLGLAAYGRTFTLASNANTAIGSQTNGGGSSGPYTREAGMLGYNEICEKLKEGGWTTVWEDNQKVPYAFNGNQWVGYDNEKSIKAKIEYAQSKNLGGVMLWSIETDDFKGSCGSKYPILNSVKKYIGQNGNNPSVPSPTPTPSPTVKPPSGSDFSCYQEGYFRDPKNCQVFYYCQKTNSGFNSSKYTCPDGTYYDNDLKVCNWINQVQC